MEATRDEPTAPATAAGTRAHVLIETGVARVLVDGLRADIALPLPEHAGRGGGARIVEMQPSRVRVREGPRVLRAFAAPDLPVVSLEWQGGDGDGDGDGDGHRMIRCDPGIDAHRANRSGIPRLVIAAVGAGGVPGAVDIDGVEAAADARARRRARERPMLEAEGVPDRLAAADHVMQSALVRDEAGRLSAHADRHAPDGGEPLPDLEQAVVALALLALNQPSLALARLGADGVTPAPLALMATGWAAWRGDAAPLMPVWPRVAAWLRSAEASGADAPVRAARTLAPIAAELVGDTASLAMLRRIPSGSGASAAAVLERLALAARGSMGEAGAEPSPVVLTAAGVLEQMHGYFGIDPDAGRGRVRLGPRPHPGPARLAGLVVGDAVLTVDARMEAPRLATITVLQHAGATPYTLILEPWLPRPIRAARVDGTVAELESRAEAGGFRVRVQVAADAERRLELELEPEPAQGARVATRTDRAGGIQQSRRLP